MNVPCIEAAAVVKLLEGIERRSSRRSDLGDKLPEPFFRCVPEFAFPHHHHFPSRRAQYRFLACIAFRVGVEFQLPALRIVGRSCCIFASSVSVPEATMDEYGYSVLGQDEIRRARQLA